MSLVKEIAGSLAAPSVLIPNDKVAQQSPPQWSALPDAAPDGTPPDATGLPFTPGRVTAGADFRGLGSELI